MVTMDAAREAGMLSKEVSELTSRLKTNIQTGLAGREASQRLQEYGQNALEIRKPVSPFTIFLNQFRNSIVFLLLAAAIISFLFHDYMEMTAILLVILINAVIGYALEIQAHRSMEALRRLDRQFARVRRDGEIISIDIREVVPGDILFLEAGDLVAADSRIVRSSNLEVNESLLTGESMPVAKTADDIPASTVIAEQQNRLFRGTAVTRGTAFGLVTGTGMSTEMGKISQMVSEAEKDKVPLNEKLQVLSKKLIWLTLGIIVVFVLIGIQSDKPLYIMLETAIALAVAAVPEGLPIVATIALARGMLRMAKQQVLVKKLAAVETLGETDLIMTDKTGTLTVNELEVKVVRVPRPSEENTDETDEMPLRKVALLCNNAQLSAQDSRGIGDPLEVALLHYVKDRAADLWNEASTWKRISEQPFESDSRIMITTHTRDSEYWSSIKGGPAEVLARCSWIRINQETGELTPEIRKYWEDEAARLANEGYKVLGFGYSTKPGEEVVFAGLAAFSDPPREDVREALQICREAGIDVVMVTGDHPGTARAVGLETGLIRTPDEPVIHGADLDETTLASGGVWTDAHVFSRVSPAQKLSLMKYYQEQGLVVAMTGDGVNDAPALRKSDIGIAMGLRGTPVAKEAADMILEDDSFYSIVKAIEQGRVIFNNIRHFVTYLISCNLSEILIVSVGAFFAISLPLLPLQILFLNLVTDVFPALALGMGGKTGEMMKGKFHRPGQPLIDGQRWRIIGGYSLVLTLSVLLTYILSITWLGASDGQANNIAFYTLAFAQLLHPFNLVSGNQSFFRNEITRNKHLWLAILFCSILLVVINYIPAIAEVLDLYRLTPQEVGLIAAGSVLPVPVIRFIKRLASGGKPAKPTR